MTGHSSAPADLDFTAYGSILVPPGSLPFALFHGESLVACAAWALDGAEVVLIDGSVTWEGLAPDEGADEEVVLVLHDALCPATPPVFIADCVQAARESGAVVVGARPVTDTVKELVGDFVGATVDREAVAQVTSPVVLPQAAFAAAARLWPGGPETVPTDAAQVVARLAEHVTVHLADAPPQSRRVEAVEDLTLLEASTGAAADS